MLFTRWLEKIKKDRTLQVDIVTLFIFLFFTSSTINILYTYKKNYSSIIEFSSSTIYRTGTVILQKIENLISTCEKAPLYINEILSEEDSIFQQDTKVTEYLQVVLQSEPDFTGLFIGENDGSFISIANLKKTAQKTFATTPEKPLPVGTMYSVEKINRMSAIPTHTYTYYNDKFHILAQEQTDGIDYDPRKRPWYIGAMEKNNLYWTDMYSFYPTFEPGISVSIPFSNSKGQIIGASGVDLSLITISDFIKTQKIGKTGTTVILDKKTGKVLMPVRWQEENESSISPAVLDLSFKRFLAKNEDSATFDCNGETFLAGFRKFPLSEDAGWVVVMVAPLSDFFSGLLQTQKEVVLISILIFVVSVIFIVLLSRRISKPISTLALEIDKIKNLELSSTVRIQSNIREINILDSSIAAMRSAVSSFTKYVPKEVVKPLIKQGRPISLGGEKKELAILFTDIVEFTHIAEGLSPDKLMPLLEEYFDQLSRIILQNEGTIDKYIGDSIMAFWGAPVDVQDSWTKACLSALLCKHHLSKFNQDRKEKGLPVFLTKFGIDSGFAIVGNIGTEERINYTALGDSINTASRLQGLNKVYHTSILISERIYEHVKEHFLIRPIDFASVKGKKEKIKVYELIASKGLEKATEATASQIDLASLFTEGYMLYEKGVRKEALAQFQRITAIHPEDGPTKYMIEKIKHNT